MIIDPSRVRFPARCAGCGAAAERTVTLESFRGIDLLYFRRGNCCEISMPLCGRCAAKRLWRRVAWVALLLPLVLIFRAREHELFQRVASPVWLRNWNPAENRVELCFADPKLAEDVALLSGLTEPPMRQAHYRESAAAPLPPVWSGPRLRSLPWWAALIVAALFFAVAAGEFFQYWQLETSGESFSDEIIFVWIYQLGGKWLLSGILAACGALFVTGGLLLRKKTV